MEKNSKSRGYVFTLNNYTDEDLAEVTLLSNDLRTRYITYGKELGEEETPHLQGCVYFHNPITFSTLKKFLTRAHIETAKGSPQQAIDYCHKDGDIFEKGDRPLTQKRKGETEKARWDAIKDCAKRGKLDEIPSDIYIKHYRTLRTIEKDFAPMPADVDGTTGFWFFGETGTGKSMKARGENIGAYLKMCNRWWDSYQNEEVVIIEDFDKVHSMLGHHLKIWADRYAFPAEIKGGKINIRPKKLIVTSNWHPKDIWGTEPQTLEPILRRFVISQFFPSINLTLHN